MNARVFEVYLMGGVFSVLFLAAITTGIVCWWKGRK
jgi:hypothetical protein